MSPLPSAPYTTTLLGWLEVGILQHIAVLHGAVRTEQWAAGILQYTTALQWGVGSGDPSAHCRTASGHWVVGIFQYTHCKGHWAVAMPRYTAALQGNSGQWVSFNTLLHYKR